MRNLLTLNFFLIMSVAATSQVVELVIQTKIYCDHCQACDACQPNIMSHVEELPGVRAAELDVKTMKITIWYQSKKIQPEQIRDAVRLSGFEADGVGPYPESYEKLEACCKKPEDR